MKVLHVIASSERGGGTDHVLGLVGELVALNVEIEVATSPGGYLVDRLHALGIRTHSVDMMMSRFDPRVPVALRQLQATVRADVVHCHGTRAAFFAQAARIEPIVYTVHGLSFRQTSRLHQAVGLLAEMIACRAREVISVSRSDLDALRRRHLLGRWSGHHIANAVDTVEFAPRSRASARAIAGISPNGFIVGTVARLVPQKGVDVLIDAIRDVPEASAVIIGDGPLRADLERRAEPLGDRVRFLGMRDDVAELLPALDVFVLASRWEGEPIALLQAMACGLACVATATGGSRELLGDERGVMIAVDDRAGLAAAIRALIHDSDRRQALGRAGRRRAKERSWPNAAECVREIYRSVADLQPWVDANGRVRERRWSR
jgi:glycosyltransferase involved in cell wall biosynthesis